MKPEQTIPMFSNPLGLHTPDELTDTSVTSPSKTLDLCVLGSGSGGNCTVIRYQNQALLLDAGLGPVTICRRLGQAKSSLEHIRAIVITHLDQDHFRPTWINTMVGWRIPLYLHAWHVPQLQRMPQAAALITSGLVRGFTEKFNPIPNLDFHPVHLRHDTQGTFGYRIDSDHGAIGFATDLGHVPDELVQKFTNVDLLALEANYDMKMQQISTRPERLKRRIMGQAGHLSNDQAFEAISRIDRRSMSGHPGHVVLLHRSEQCNSEEKVREVFAQDQSLLARTVLTQQRRRTRWFKINSTRKSFTPVDEQLLLGF
jgi:phosphoribosyl 1,2-cyclic phosphodiesterase